MQRRFGFAVLIFALGLFSAAIAAAQTAPPLPNAGFAMTGFIQQATLDGTVAGTAAVPLPNTDLRAGGTLTVNGITILVPNNTYVQLPANAMTWQQLFDPRQSRAIGEYVPARLNHSRINTGLALADPLINHFPAYEVTVTGNIVPHPANGTPQYIAGLIAPVTQHGLMGIFGIINYIDYDGSVLGMPGRFRVGGVLNDPGTGTLVEINDPVGRWGAVHSPDPRFTTDTGNQTVMAVNGYPVGIPLVAPRFLPGGGLDPAFIGDPERPYTNRPLNGDARFPRDPFLAVGAPLKTFTMPPPGTAGSLIDPTKQIPLMVGDAVDVAGTLMKIDQKGANTPDNMFVSAHTVEADLGIFTSPGTRPCYLMVEALLIPTAQVRNQPQTIAGDPSTAVPLENSTTMVIVGFTTDPTQLVDLYAIDVDPGSGEERERFITALLPETLGPGRVRGRFRFEPTLALGIFPATRDYIVKSHNGQMPAANGLISGQYRLPNFDYLFAERTVFGNPTVPNAFNMMPFLANGGQSTTQFNGRPGPVLGRLDPWPGP